MCVCARNTVTFFPCSNETVPEGGDGDLHWIMVLVLLLFMLYLMLLCVYRLMIRKHVKEVKTELEKGEILPTTCQIFVQQASLSE